MRLVAYFNDLLNVAADLFPNFNSLWVPEKIGKKTFSRHCRRGVDVILKKNCYKLHGVIIDLNKMDALGHTLSLR